MFVVLMFVSPLLNLLVGFFSLLLLEIHQLLIPGIRVLLDAEAAADLTVLEGGLFTDLGARADDAALEFDIVLEDRVVHHDRVDNLDVFTDRAVGPDGRLLDRRAVTDLGVLANEGVRAHLCLHLAGRARVPDLVCDLCVLVRSQGKIKRKRYKSLRSLNSYFSSLRH